MVTSKYTLGMVAPLSPVAPLASLAAEESKLEASCVVNVAFSEENSLVSSKKSTSSNAAVAAVGCINGSCIVSSQIAESFRSARFVKRLSISLSNQAVSCSFRFPQAKDVFTGFPQANRPGNIPSITGATSLARFYSKQEFRACVEYNGSACIMLWGTFLMPGSVHILWSQSSFNFIFFETCLRERLHRFFLM